MQQRSKARFKDIELTRVYISLHGTKAHPLPTPTLLSPSLPHTSTEKLPHKAATTSLQHQEHSENFVKCWGTRWCICSAAIRNGGETYMLLIILPSSFSLSLPRLVIKREDVLRERCHAHLVSSWEENAPL